MSMSIVNLTQHVATPEQTSQGVVDLQADDRTKLQQLITFHVIPSSEEIRERAEAAAELAVKNGAASAMIGGAPFFMSALEKALWSKGVTPLYAFSVRESQDQVLADGSVRKVAVFKHVGFVEACR